MSNITIQNAIENALIKGDLSQLNPEQRLSYYKSVCESVGLNTLTKPFEYIQLNGKLTLYATRACTDQLRSVHKVSVKITAREKFDDIYIVTAQATNSEGRFDESTGAVNVSNLKGEALANAYLKAETKAKRRVTLSLCGLGLLDESEVETIAYAKPFIEQKQQEKPVNIEATKSGHKVERLAEPKDDIPENKFNLSPEIAKLAGQPVDYSDHVLTLGLNKGKTLKEISPSELLRFTKRMRDENRVNSSNSQEIEIVEAYLKTVDHFDAAQPVTYKDE